MEKKLSYRLSSPAYMLDLILKDYAHLIDNYRMCINNKQVLNTSVFNTLILDPAEFDFNVEVAWQDLLRQTSYYNQQGKSLLTGKILNVKTMQLHHALITKGMIRGKKGLDRYLIHHSYNVMLLNREEHLDGQDGADNRELCAKKLSKLYGERHVKLWYFNFPMKSKLPNIF